ncbi:MAG TPA: hypothetical protein VN848_12130 [Gemmatimonadales bacterium]|nr:hypothetical protein [Gemmatimonadales bacterium]
MSAFLRSFPRALILGALVVAGAAPLKAQDPRDAMVARAFNEFDAARRAQLLMSALNPVAGPPRGAWAVGVQLLAQTLIEDHQDSIAGVWLRWAVRLSPDLQPDTVQFLPQVIAAYRRARDYVQSTRRASDSAAATTWLWPGPSADKTGRLHIAPSGLTVPVRVEIRGVGPAGVDASLTLAPGSYEIMAAAPGYDTARVTREVLPGITTVLEFHLHATALAQAASKPQVGPTPAAQPAAPAVPRPPPAAVAEKKGGFPVVLALVGVGAVAVIAAVAGGGSKGGSSGGGGGGGVTTGGITITFPNP